MENRSTFFLLMAMAICHPYSYGLAKVVGMTNIIATIGFTLRRIREEYVTTPSARPYMNSLTQKGVIKEKIHVSFPGIRD
ncbi:MAG TPA: hypothetical protein PKW97_13025 [Syntrophorhabdus sp.]|jgi:nitrate reductase gamma subunit|nr:hypothetical protein [Syntrophorhabdus sp.]NMC93183.1 hypothetical protein [Syntrophorhabdus sp.]HOD78277.1 hypothetical protein [Syntrophorhabdus sp.]HQH81928.1 hypothetical protein [Syntrophorhabdus sp.]HQM27418.1 hypothetical protein [Syntrophorhabdus sp.]